MKATYTDLELQLMYRRRSRGADELTDELTGEWQPAAQRRRMNRRHGGAVLASVLALTGCGPVVAAPTTEPVAVAAEVVAVVDGDTIDVATDDGTARVRLIGIDTPEIGREGETSECNEEDARTFLRLRIHLRHLLRQTGLIP